MQYSAYSPNTTPIDIDVVDIGIQFGRNVIILTLRKYNVASMTTFVECFEDIGDIVGGTSIGEDSALRSIAGF